MVVDRNRSIRLLSCFKFRKTRPDSGLGFQINGIVEDPGAVRFKRWATIVVADRDPDFGIQSVIACCAKHDLPQSNRDPAAPSNRTASL